MAGFPYARVLLATEHSVYDGGAESLALALARRHALALSVVLPVRGNPEFEVEAPGLSARLDAGVALERQSLEASARAQGVACEVAVRHGVDPAAEIVGEALARGSDLIVIRRRGQRGLLASLLMGEMVSQVVAHAPCDVLIVPRGAPLWSRGVLVGVDPDGGARAAVRTAAELASACGLPLHLLMAVERDGESERGLTEMQAALDLARAVTADVHADVQEGPAPQLLPAATRRLGTDLLVLARQGAAATRPTRVGATTHRVIGGAECPVLICSSKARSP